MVRHRRISALGRGCGTRWLTGFSRRFVPSLVINDVNAQQGLADEEDGGFLIEIYRAR